MKSYRAAVIGCSRMGAFIDNEVIGHPNIVLPYSHAAGFFACPRTELVACADLRVNVMEEFGRVYNVPKSRQYTDYKEMIAKEKLDIVSVATQPEPRAEVVIYAAAHGIKAIYAEKAMSASLAEADAMVAALEKHGVAFNLGTNRRWSTQYDRMKAIIDSGELGALKSIIVYNTGTLFNTGSHNIDLMMRLNSDQPALWAQGHLPKGDALLHGEILRDDPNGEGIVHFANGVTGYLLLTPRSSEYEAICEQGIVTAYNDAAEIQVRRKAAVDSQGNTGLVADAPLAVEKASSTLRLIEDLVHSLDTGEPPRGGPRVSLASTELIFALIESHRQGGARVSLPLTARTVRLQRDHTPRQPRFNA